MDRRLAAAGARVAAVARRQPWPLGCGVRLIGLFAADWLAGETAAVGAPLLRMPDDLWRPAAGTPAVFEPPRSELDRPCGGLCRGADGGLGRPQGVTRTPNLAG